MVRAIGRAWLAGCALVFALLSAPSARADGFIVVPRPAAMTLPPGHPPWAPLEVQSHRVRIAVRDQVAVTEVDEVFHNPNALRVEGEYLFPIPKNATIDRFSMEIDGKQQTAELVDAAQARTLYEDIVRRMRDPALLEYGERGLFRVRAFPIEPNGSKHVTIRYSQVLRRDGPVVELDYPLDTERFSSAPIDTVTVEVHIESKEALKSVWSPSHAVEVTRKGDHEALAGFELTHARPDSDFQLFYTVDEKQPVGLGVLTHRVEGEDDGYFLLLASAGAEDDAAKRQPEDVVFAVDTSGSMAGPKIEQLKRALRYCIQGLGERDRFEIVRFSTEAEPLFGSLVDASPANRTKALSFVDGFHAAGGTAIQEALDRSLHAGDSVRDATRDAGRPYLVAFLTDGQPTVGETDPQKLADLGRAAVGKTGARVFTFGVGTDVDTRLLDQLAEASRGASQYVGDRDDIERAVSSFYARVAQPVMTGLTLRTEGDIRLLQSYPQALPDLFHGDQLVVVGRYRGAGEGRVIVSGTVGGESRELASRVVFPAKGPGPADAESGNPFVPRLWATRRVGYLLDEIRQHGENAELRDEIVQLARRHGIVTPYTSYLILEDERRKDVPQPLASAAPRNEAASSRLHEAFDVLARERSGAEAVAGAQVVGSLKGAPDLDASTRYSAGYASDYAVHDRKALAGSAGGGAPAEPPPSALDASQAQRHAAGKTFYRNGDRWIDGEVAEHPHAKPTRVELGSPEYFELIRKNKNAGAWLAQGQRLVVVIDGNVYEIIDSKGEN